MKFPLSLAFPASARLALVLSVAFAPSLLGAEAPGEAAKRQQVGKAGPNRYFTPANQVLTPAGVQVELPGLRPQAIALSPDARLLVTSGKTAELVVLDPKSGKILQRVAFPGKVPVVPESTLSPGDAAPQVVGTQVKPDTGAQLSFTGMVFSPEGQRLYLSNVNGDIKVFSIEKDGKVVGLKTFALPDVKGAKRKQEIPAGLAVSRDGKFLYVAGNLGNRLIEIETATGLVARMWDAGVAPFDVALAEGKAYVSNWGGRRPGKGDLTGPAGRGTTVRVDPVRSIASEGSVTIVDLQQGRVSSELLVGLHASAIAASPDGKYVVVANSGSDTLSVIDTRTDKIAERIWTREPSDLFGGTPNALTFDKTGKWLMVCNATQNAVAVIKFNPTGEEGSKLVGMVPVGWFPGAIVYDAVHKLMCVANIKGIGSTRRFKPGEKVKLNSKDYFGTLSLVPVPSEKELGVQHQIVLANMRYPLLEAAKLPPRAGEAAKPVPERVGEPSVFKHVLYIIKENRTYDQILGDMKTGNGDPSLTLFGEKVTPNQHKLAREFVLLDNTYCSGIQSADGHQWTDSAITTDYVERGHAGWPRSYPNMKTEDSMDALAYSSAGFIWDNARAHKVSVRNYGEACISECGWKDKSRKGKPTWTDYFRDFTEGTGLTMIRCKPGIETMRSFCKLDTVGWDMTVPDVIRAAEFIKELKGFEKKGEMPQLMIMLLPNDHTGGAKAGVPTPAAQVADNDLAFGRIVEAISHSAFWKDTCIFAIEDDPQNGADHVSGYRTTAYVASAYTKRGKTVSTQYNNTSIVRTIELILGLPPMNIMDASATPMSDCFNEVPDLTPFNTVPNQIPLALMNPEPKQIADRQLRRDAIVSAKLPLSEPDKCDEDLLNRILWRAVKGTKIPYPEWAVTKVEDDDD